MKDQADFLRQIAEKQQGGDMDHSDVNPSGKSSGIIPPHGGYQDLKSYQMAEIVHDGTAVFCDRFIDRRSRTHDQMVQAARNNKP